MARGNRRERIFRDQADRLLFYQTLGEAPLCVVPMPCSPSPEEKEHFATCSECGEIFDRRSLDEVLFHHTDHKYRPDVQYSGSTRL
jgi:hypothetical protein